MTSNKILLPIQINKSPFAEFIRGDSSFASKAYLKLF
jgi:hypothetical protein